VEKVTVPKLKKITSLDYLKLNDLITEANLCG